MMYSFTQHLFFKLRFLKLSLGNICLVLALQFSVKNVYSFVLNRSKVCSKSGAYGNGNANRTVCKDLYTGTISIKNEESFIFNITKRDLLNRTAELHDAGNVGFSINIEKSKVSYSYQLRYIIDVFDRFQEDIYQYTWQEAGDNPPKFCFTTDLNKCEDTGQLAKAPDGTELPWGYGRCCWCPQTQLVETYTDYRRGKFNCNFADLIFRNGVWVSKSCPRVFGPWYSALEIGQFTWQFSVKLDLQWWSAPKNKDVDFMDRVAEETVKKCKQSKAKYELPPDQDCQRLAHRQAGIVQRTYYLNFSNPEIYDPEYDIRFRIKGGGPQVAQNPPNLNDKILFIPSYPSDDPIVRESKLEYGCSTEFDETAGYPDPLKEPEFYRVCASGSVYCNPKSCLKHALLISKDHVDTTGLTCNKIGVSTRMWGDMNGRFCSYPPGTCIGNQIGSFRQEDEMRRKQGKPMKYHLTSMLGGYPRYYNEPLSQTANLKDNETRHYLGWTYEKEHITNIDFEIDAAEIAWLRTVSPGHITFIEYPLSGECSRNIDDGCPIKVYVLNSGNVEARFLVQVPFCRDAESNNTTSDIAPIDPIGNTVPPNGTVVFTLLMKVLITERRDYVCNVQLFDAEHQMLDEDIFNLSMGNLTKSYQGLQRPVIPARVILHSAKIMEKGSILGWDLPGIPLASFECDCNINPVCYIANVSSCFEKMKRYFITIFVVVGIFVLLVLFSPCLFSFFAKCAGKTFYFLCKCPFDCIASARKQRRIAKNNNNLTFREKRIVQYENNSLHETISQEKKQHE